MRIIFEVTGWPPSTPQNRHVTDLRMATPGFLSTLRIPIVSGRGILPTDDAGSVPVLLVSQAFVKSFFPHENPIGKHITLGYHRQRSADPRDTVSVNGTIVGVVGDIKARDLTLPPAVTLYVPFAQFPFTGVSILARSAGSPATLISELRTAIHDVDANLPVYDVETMTDAVSDSIAQPRFYTLLLGGFAGVALLIAALGIYGVISYAVSLRTREMGIRMSLGASRGSVVGLVLGQGLRLTIAGVVLGLFGAFDLTRLIAKLLFNVPPSDPLTFLSVGALLIGVATAASYVPARRAARVDPVLAMRAE